MAIFDNMNYFFSHNGYQIVDRSDLKEDEITFKNAWGVCDQDLFNRTLKECDKSFAAGKTISESPDDHIEPSPFYLS